MQECQFRAMGCQMLAIIDADSPAAAARLQMVPGWFAQWEQQLSRFRADSDLSRLNSLQGRAVVVTPVLWEVLAVALDAAQQSDGLVQPTLLAQLEAAGYDRSFDTLGLDTPGGSRVARVPDWRAITREPDRHAVMLPLGTRLDLGGVAKGWAADQAVHRLASFGPTLVDAGGDIAVSGPMADGQPWPIAIADPFCAEDSRGLLLLPTGAVATSGRDYRRWLRGGVEQHHIIDPRTGAPARTDVLSATIVAPNGPMAEMAAKVALIRGSQDALAWLNAHPLLAGLLVLDDGRVMYSDRMDEKLDHNGALVPAAPQRDVICMQETHK